MTNARYMLNMLDATADIIVDNTIMFNYEPCENIAYINVLDIIYSTALEIIKDADALYLRKLKYLLYSFPVYRPIDMILGLVQNIAHNLSICFLDDIYYYLNIDDDDYLYTNSKYLSYTIPTDF